MASIVRPTMFRQKCLTAVSKQAFSTKLGPSIPAITRSPLVVATRGSFANDALPRSVQAAAFHASGKRQLLPAGPQVLTGGPNDAAAVPATNPSHGSYHWTFERILCVGLVPLTIAPFASGSLNPITDALLCGTILVHSHIGFDAMITDYVPPRRFPKSAVASSWALRAVTVLVGVGLYEFETNDVGLTEAIKKVWTA